MAKKYRAKFIAVTYGGSILKSMELCQVTNWACRVKLGTPRQIAKHDQNALGQTLCNNKAIEANGIFPETCCVRPAEFHSLFPKQSSQMRTLIDNSPQHESINFWHPRIYASLLFFTCCILLVLSVLYSCSQHNWHNYCFQWNPRFSLCRLFLER